MDKVRQYNPLDMGYTGTAGKEPPQSIRIQSGVVDKGIKRRKAKGEPLNFNVLAGAILTGIDIIKESLKKAEDAAKGKIYINYLGSGMYRFMIKDADYKGAEKLMKNATESAIQFVTKHDGKAEFNRVSS